MVKRFITTMENLRIDGADPVLVPAFLAASKVEANKNGLSDVTENLVLTYFLMGNARIAYDWALHVDVIDCFWVRIRSRPNPIHWLLRS